MKKQTQNQSQTKTGKRMKQDTKSNHNKTLEKFKSNNIFFMCVFLFLSMFIVYSCSMV